MSIRQKISATFLTTYFISVPARLKMHIVANTHLHFTSPTPYTVHLATKAYTHHPKHTDNPPRCTHLGAHCAGVSSGAGEVFFCWGGMGGPIHQSKRRWHDTVWKRRLPLPPPLVRPSLRRFCSGVLSCRRVGRSGGGGGGGASSVAWQCSDCAVL